MIKTIDFLPKIASFAAKKDLLTWLNPKKWTSSPRSGYFVDHRVKRKGYKWKRYFKYKMHMSALFDRIPAVRMPKTSEGFIKMSRYTPKEDLPE